MTLISKSITSCCFLSSLPHRFFSSGTALHGRYSKTHVDPNPDPNSYLGSPDPSDQIALRPVKAAPTCHTYSVFYDEKLYKFEKMILKKGKSGVSKRVSRDCLQYIKSVQVRKYHRASEEEKPLIELNPLVIFHQAFENCKPLLDLEKVKKSGRTYMVPIPMKPKKQFFFSYKAMQAHVWSGHPNTDCAIRFGKEILAAYENEGAAVRAKQLLHKQAYANRAYKNLR